MLIRKEIEKRFPNHGIIGEEYGITRPDAAIQWVLDPIDGTKSFIHGVPFYTTLIGIMIDKEPIIGVINAPALDECCVAGKGLGAYFNRKPCSVRETRAMSEATLLVTEIKRFQDVGKEDEFQELMAKTKL